MPPPSTSSSIDIWESGREFRILVFFSLLFDNHIVMLKHKGWRFRLNSMD
ncbi:hypothetical protein RT761_00152 [Atribacter laminatus]|uniref:Uncharacterized protein n=1 Tax=Atribacter laminatus TaxID=2847778 RepID=A0A7T1AJA9_ATRLM|nr:hypothetical protein RT761_00152 [Atribacter laminatus]